METVLVVGSTGNIGTAAVIGALRSGRNVLAIVRNQNSADKLVKSVGKADGITFAYADVASTTGIKSVVEQVRAGKLPAFQHVWSTGMFGFSSQVELVLTLLRSWWRICRNSASGDHG